MALIEHKCFSATCDSCGIEFQTEIDGNDSYYFMSEIELLEAFYDEDWGVVDGKYKCKKCYD